MDLARKIYTGLGWFLCLGVAAYAFQAPLGNAAQKLQFLAFHLEARPLVFMAHIFGGATALAVLPLQFTQRLRQGRWLAWHRWIGRLYGVAILIGGLAGLWLSITTDSPLPAALGFGALAVAWLAVTGFGIYLAMTKQISRHRVWMTYSAALTCAAVSLRVQLPLLTLAGLPIEPAYIFVAWSCWVPSLAAVWLWRNWKTAQQPGLIREA